MALASPATGHWGTCPTSTSKNCLIFLVTPEPHKLWNWSLVWLPAQESIQFSLLHEFHNVFLYVSPLNSFLLTPNPSDATEGRNNFRLGLHDLLPWLIFFSFRYFFSLLRMAGARAPFIRLCLSACFSWINYVNAPTVCSVVFRPLGLAGWDAYTVQRDITRNTHWCLLQARLTLLPLSSSLFWIICCRLYL